MGMTMKQIRTALVDEMLRRNLSNERFAREVLEIDPGNWTRIRDGNTVSLGQKAIQGISKNLPWLYHRMMPILKDEPAEAERVA